MSERAVKAVEDARELANDMHADGRFREAAIVHRLCRGNDSYRVTLGQLWRDNMELRAVVERQAQRLAELESRQAA